MRTQKINKKDVEILRTIAEFAIEEYRFMRVFDSAVNKLYPEERNRYVITYKYHENKVRELLEKFGLRAVAFDGQDYDEGFPVTPLNADEFDASSDQLFVEQTIEPTVITLEGNIIRQGTVILARKENSEENNTSEDKD